MELVELVARVSKSLTLLLNLEADFVRRRRQMTMSIAWAEGWPVRALGS